MEIVYAISENEDQVKLMLSENGLPFEDITLAHLDTFLLARDRNRLVGLVGLEILGKFGLLRSLVVEPASRQRGIASKLVASVEKLAAAKGIKELYLLTNTAEDFFARRGYRRIERGQVPQAVQGTTEFRSLCPSSSTCMVKNMEGWKDRSAISPLEIDKIR